MKPTIISAAALAILVLAGCSSTAAQDTAAQNTAAVDTPSSSEPAPMFTADPTPTDTTTTVTETPEPVDPDVAWAVGYRNSGALKTLRTTVNNVTKTIHYLEAYNLSAASVSALSVSIGFDTVVVQAKSVPGWQKSPLAQQSIDTFTDCSTAWSDASTAVSGTDPAAVNQATGKIQACTVSLERTNKHVNTVANR